MNNRPVMYIALLLDVLGLVAMFIPIHGAPDAALWLFGGAILLAIIGSIMGT